MKVTRFLSAVLCLLAAGFIARGQTAGTGLNSGSMGSVMDVLDPQYQNSSLLYAKASPDDAPFLVNEYCKGEIVLKNGKKVSIELKYDIYQQLVLINTGSDMGIINSSLIDFFQMNLPGETDPSVFMPKTLDGSLAFYQVVYDGDIKVLKKFEKKRRVRIEANATGYNTDGPKLSNFVKSVSYFFLINDQLIKFKLGKKSVLAALNESKYNDCAKNLDLKLNKEQDLIYLLKECK